jgi:hypothetical protein
MSRAAILLAAALAGCSPFATFPQAAQKNAVKGPRVAICYNPVASKESAVAKAAGEQCAANRVAVRVATDWHLNYCPLFLPARATFTCAAKK